MVVNYHSKYNNALNSIHSLRIIGRRSSTRYDSQALQHLVISTDILLLPYFVKNDETAKISAGLDSAVV